MSEAEHHFMFGRSILIYIWYSLFLVWCLFFPYSFGWTIHLFCLFLSQLCISVYVYICIMFCMCAHTHILNVHIYIIHVRDVQHTICKGQYTCIFWHFEVLNFYIFKFFIAFRSCAFLTKAFHSSYLIEQFSLIFQTEWIFSLSIPPPEHKTKQNNNNERKNILLRMWLHSM